MNKENILLIEIGTEELPPKDLQKLSLSLQEIFAKELKLKQLQFREIVPFATPRRLALQIFGLPEQQTARAITKRGPALKEAFDDAGTPSKATLGFAASCHTTVDKLQRQETPKGTWLCFTEEIPGLSTTKLIPEILEQALTQLPIAKRMRWGTQAQSFVRPVHWLVLLFNNEVIDATIFGIKSDRNTYGHRFHHPEQIPLPHASSYEIALEQQGMVIPSFKKRLALVKTGAEAKATECGGQLLAENNALLELITSLVEYPVPMVGHFNTEYLAIPKEALIASIQEHQKCLPIIDSNGKLMAKFILISNIKSTEPATVIYGNELVMHARLADAAFLFKEDQKHPLAANIETLKTITFQAKLGSLYEKTVRIEKLAVGIAEQIGADIAHTTKAAHLCKADLASKMVYEFPELQGIMGYYYAEHDGLPTSVATAIKEHYLPKFAQDSLPLGLPGICVAIADRIDTLVGLFAIDKIPTGEKDPFALKRQALAILRIIIEKSLPLDLQKLCTDAYNNYTAKIQNINSTPKLIDFFFERLRYWYLAANGQPKVFEAVLAKQPTCPFDFYYRLLAVQTFQALPEAESLAAANKRVKNILAQASEFILSEVDVSIFEDQAEHALLKAIQQNEHAIAPLLAQAEYPEILKMLAVLKEPIDLFFEKVMVMTENIKIRNNRLNLLHRLRALFLEIADVSLL